MGNPNENLTYETLSVPENPVWSRVILPVFHCTLASEPISDTNRVGAEMMNYPAAS